MKINGCHVAAHGCSVIATVNTAQETTFMQPTKRRKTMAEYIDREAAQKQVDKELYMTESEKAYTKSIIRKVPAADVAPVVHGWWMFRSTQGHSWMKCSHCLKSQSGWTGVFTYCPNCGAKMGGDADVSA